MYIVMDHVPQRLSKMVFMTTDVDHPALALYAAGNSLQKIARDTGLKYNVVRNVVLDAGLMRTRAESNRKAGRTHKKCGRCEEIKPVEEFASIRYPSGNMGRHGYCNPCNVAYNRLWRVGMTQEQYDAKVAEQNGLCMICGEPPTADENPRTSVLHIDHNHKTNALRDLLCWRCNCGLGNFGDDIGRMTSALAYLVRHKVG